MLRLGALLALMLALAACGDRSGPCDDSDPTGICANSHSQSYDAH